MSEPAIVQLLLSFEIFSSKGYHRTLLSFLLASVCRAHYRLFRTFTYSHHIPYILYKRANVCEELTAQVLNELFSALTGW